MDDFIQDIDFDELGKMNDDGTKSQSKGNGASNGNSTSKDSTSKENISRSGLPATRYNFKRYQDYREVWEKQDEFLDNLEKYVSLGNACKASGISTRQFYKWMDEDEMFKRKYEIAEIKSNRTIDDEIVNRAVHGYDEPVYYRDQLIGYKRIKSDFLLAKLAAARMPDKYGTKTESGATHNNNVIILPPNGRDLNLDGKEQAPEQKQTIVIPKREEDGEIYDSSEIR